MTLFFSLLPFYLFGNFHCLGMCGPLVMMLGKHPYRTYYFLGRLLAFSWAGLLAGWGGAVIQVVLQRFQISGLTSLFLGFAMLLWGVFNLCGWKPRMTFFSRWTFWIELQQFFASLPLQQTAQATFLFGFLTLLLPCGQTIFVFSACALTGDPFIGLLNGLAFALLTSPSLYFAMQAHALLKRFQAPGRIFLPLIGIVGGLVSCFRGLTDLGWISLWSEL